MVWMGIAVYALRRNGRLDAMHGRAPSDFELPVCVPRFEFGGDLRQRQAFDLEQQQRVVQEIRGLADDLSIGLRDAGQRQFQAFLADLLRDAPRALARAV